MRIGAGLAGASLLIVAALLRGHASTLVAIASYACLAATLACACVSIGRFRHSVAIYSAIAAGVMGAAAWSDEYTTSGQAAGATQVDHFRRWSDTPYRRHVSSPRFIASGPIAGSNGGSPHGEWFVIENGKARAMWFWYGEVVTEGDWHLRNR